MYSKYLHQLEAQNLRRSLQITESPCQATVMVEGRTVILLASNDYLGLANHPKVKEAAVSAIQRFGVGSGASRLISGSLLPHQELETTLAAFKGTESALTFGSGYATNVGLIPALIGSEGLILADRLCHASLIDGCRTSKATLRIFHHNDLEHLKKLLTKRSAQRPTLIITEGVFSMDGDLAPLPEFVKLAQEFEAHLLVDDAHGTGVMGSNGRGIIEHFGLDPNSLSQMGTLSKAIGASGGYVVGSASFIQYLVNTCRSFIYTTAPPPAMAAAADTAIKMVQSDADRRHRLWKNRDHLYKNLTSMGFTLTHSQSPILPIILNKPKLAIEMSTKLLTQGVFVPAIRPPTVPKGTSRLRVTVTSEHTFDQLNTALSAFKKIGQELRVM